MMSAQRVLAAIWLVAGLGILIRACEAHWQLLASAEPFNIAEGGEQSVLIFEAVGLFALIQAFLLWRQSPAGYWPRKGATWFLVFGSSIWLLLGGPVYEPWYSSASVGLLLIASVWYAAVPRDSITPNSAMDSDTVRSALRAPHGARHRER